MASYQYQQEVQEIDKNDDKIYYNISVLGGGGAKCEFSTTRRQPVIIDPSKYYMTIDKVSIPTEDIPIMIMPIQTGQANPNLSPFSVTLSFGGTDVQTFVLYYTTTPLEPVPAPPLVTQDINVDNYYYRIYEYDHFINMFNTAFATSFTALKIAHPAMVPVTAPYFVYNKATNLISLIVEYAYTLAGAPQIWVNAETRTYFDAIEGTFLTNAQPAGKDSQYLPSLKPGQYNAYYPPGQTAPATVVFPGYTVPNFVEMSQNYLTVPTWTSLQNIILTSNSLPVVHEMISSSASLQAIATGSRGDPVGVPILTDFTPDIKVAGEVRTQFIYYPVGPYRLINMNGNMPLRDIEIKARWRDKDGLLFPIRIGEHQEFQVKLLFIKKSTFTS